MRTDELLASIGEKLPGVRLVLCRPVVRHSSLCFGSCLVHGDDDLTQAARTATGKAVHVLHGMEEPRAAARAFHLSEGGKNELAPIKRPHPLLPVPLEAQPLAGRGYGAFLVHASDTLGWLYVGSKGALKASQNDILKASLPRLRRHLLQSERPQGKHSTGVLAVDTSGDLTPANDAARRWLGDSKLARTIRSWWTSTPAKQTMLGSDGLAQRAGKSVVLVRPIRLPRSPAGLPLTPTQRTVTEHLLNACTLEMIADELGRRPSTIAEHRTEAYKRLGVEARVELPEMFDHP